MASLSVSDGRVSERERGRVCDMMFMAVDALSVYGGIGSDVSGPLSETRPQGRCLLAGQEFRERERARETEPENEQES